MRDINKNVFKGAFFFASQKGHTFLRLVNRGRDKQGTVCQTLHTNRLTQLSGICLTRIKLGLIFTKSGHTTYLAFFSKFSSVHAPKERHFRTDVP